MTYNDLINAFNAREEDGDQRWTYKEIVGHRLKKEGRWEVQVLWDTDETIWETMQVIKEDDKMTLAAYAHENQLTDKPG